jgi:hypothetical protein
MPETLTPTEEITSTGPIRIGPASAEGIQMGYPLVIVGADASETALVADRRDGSMKTTPHRGVHS